MVPERIVLTLKKTFWGTELVPLKGRETKNEIKNYNQTFVPLVLCFGFSELASGFLFWVLL